MFHLKIVLRHFPSLLLIEVFCLLLTDQVFFSSGSHSSSGPSINWSVGRVQRICTDPPNEVHGTSIVRPRRLIGNFPRQAPALHYRSTRHCRRRRSRVGRVGTKCSGCRYATESSNTTRLLFSGQSCVDCRRDNMCYQFR